MLVDHGLVLIELAHHARLGLCGGSKLDGAIERLRGEEALFEQAVDCLKLVVELLMFKLLRDLVLGDDAAGGGLGGSIQCRLELGQLGAGGRAGCPCARHCGGQDALRVVGREGQAEQVGAGNEARSMRKVAQLPRQGRTFSVSEAQSQRFLAVVTRPSSEFKCRAKCKIGLGNIHPGVSGGGDRCARVTLQKAENESYPVSNDTIAQYTSTLCPTPAPAWSTCHLCHPRFDPVQLPPSIPRLQ